jgi:hypothetical protein
MHLSREGPSPLQLLRRVRRRKMPSLHSTAVEPSPLSTKRVQSMSLKFFWKGQQCARVPGPSRPVYQIPVLLKFCNLPKPLRPVLVRNSHHVGKITGSQAAANRHLNALQQAPGGPFFLEPLDRNGRSTVFSVSTAASLAHRKMSDN